MLKTFTRTALAAIVGVAVVASPMQPAEAGRGGRFAAGIAAGIIGLGLLGAYAHGRDRDYYDDRDNRECYRGPERCGWVKRRCFENDYGDVVCRGGRYTCWRENYCD